MQKLTVCSNNYLRQQAIHKIKSFRGITVGSHADLMNVVAYTIKLQSAQHLFPGQAYAYTLFQEDSFVCDTGIDERISVHRAVTKFFENQVIAGISKRQQMFRLPIVICYSMWEKCQLIQWLELHSKRVYIIYN